MVCLAVLFCTSMAACKKQNNTSTPQTELEKLPPITQTGANTFGCLVNGVAWLPNGSSPQYGRRNIRLDVDPNLSTGLFQVIANQYNEGAGNFITVGTYGCRNSGVFRFGQDSIFAQYSKAIAGSNWCQIASTTAGSYKTGYLNITYYNQSNGIYSGIFEFTLYDSNNTCNDTLKITNGRFDVKL